MAPEGLRSRRKTKHDYLEITSCLLQHLQGHSALKGATMGFLTYRWCRIIESHQVIILSLLFLQWLLLDCHPMSKWMGGTVGIGLLGFSRCWIFRFYYKNEKARLKFFCLHWNKEKCLGIVLLNMFRIISKLHWMQVLLFCFDFECPTPGVILGHNHKISGYSPEWLVIPSCFWNMIANHNFCVRVFLSVPYSLVTFFSNLFQGLISDF